MLIMPERFLAFSLSRSLALSLLRFLIIIVLASLPGGARAALSSPVVENVWPLQSSGGFTFAIAADMRSFAGPGIYDTSQYFRGACETLAALGKGDFMVSPGDLDPPSGALWTITKTLGSTYTWYPVVGNHDLPGANLEWLNAYDYGVVNPGPSGCPTTTYSFDHENAHFVMLNVYCDSAGDHATTGDVPDHLYNWLADDLNSTTKSVIFVFGHEPAYPQPDADNGRERHFGDSLDQYPAHRDRFWELLHDHGAVAYICGHTHNYSLVQMDDVWQLDAGHARGKGDAGARSTFVVIHVNGGRVTFATYRDDANDGTYIQRYGGVLYAPYSVYLPLILRSP
ncbi:MAG: metallophosphoesterase [Anaerolineae bacterium]|nr:metallophosphoesterase [Anaerolineae bacterium]